MSFILHCVLLMSLGCLLASPLPSKTEQSNSSPLPSTTQQSKSTPVAIKKSADSSVFFSAVRTSRLTTGTSAITITYDETNANVGGGYSSSTGHFVAPVAGYYFFAMSLNTELSRSGRVFLKHDGDTAMGAIDEAGGSDSNQIILNLKAGDDVWTELSGGYDIYSSSSRYVTFTGFLVSS